MLSRLGCGPLPFPSACLPLLQLSGTVPGDSEETLLGLNSRFASSPGHAPSPFLGSCCPSSLSGGSR